MTGSFTPGPWWFDGDWHRLPTIFDADGIKIAIIEKSHVVNRKSVDIVGREANARLIAAAPEMYEACASVWAALSATEDGHLLQLAYECRDALAKASGEDFRTSENGARQHG